MNLSAPFIRRPIATVLLTLGVALAGIAAFFVLPVSPLPEIDVPSISVSANLPGASPETMATSVATPLERHLGIISDVTGINLVVPLLVPELSAKNGIRPGQLTLTRFGKAGCQ